MASRGSAPTWWGRFVMLAHRENTPRTQCRGCAGGGEINGVRCSSCSGRGWFDRDHRPGKTTDDIAF